MATILERLEILKEKITIKENDKDINEICLYGHICKIEKRVKINNIDYSNVYKFKNNTKLKINENYIYKGYRKLVKIPNNVFDIYNNSHLKKKPSWILFSKEQFEKYLYSNCFQNINQARKLLTTYTNEDGITEDFIKYLLDNNYYLLPEIYLSDRIFSNDFIKYLLENYNFEKLVKVRDNIDIYTITKIYFEKLIRTQTLNRENIEIILDIFPDSILYIWKNIQRNYKKYENIMTDAFECHLFDLNEKVRR